MFDPTLVYILINDNWLVPFAIVQDKIAIIIVIDKWNPKSFH